MNDKPVDEQSIAGTKTEQSPAQAVNAATLLNDSEDFALPVCTLRPGDADFAGCEACQ